MDIKALRQKKADLKKDMLAMLDAAAGREFSVDEQTKYDAMKASLESNERLIKREEERMDLERETAGAAFDQRRASGQIQVHELFEDDPKGGFKNHRDFFTSVMKAGM